MTLSVYARASANLDAQRRMGLIVGSSDLGGIDEVLAPDLVDHDPAPGQLPGAAGLRDYWAGFRRAFPDVAFEPIEMVATEEFVTAVLEVSGTHRGEFLGHAGTGRTFRVRAVQLGRFLDGRMTERWGSMDHLAMLQQLGLL